MTHVKFLLVIGVLAVLVNEGQMQNWLDGLDESLRNLNSRIHNSVKNLQESITKNVNMEVQQAINNGHGVVIDNDNVVIGNNGGVSILRSPGHSRTITTGTLPNGQPYQYDVEERIVGRTLIHTERISNDTAKGVQVLGYTINLDDPHAVPVPLKTSE